MMGGIIGVTLYLMVLATWPVPTFIGTGVVIVVYFAYHYISAWLWVRKQRKC